jgi:hypothetical protein
MIQVTMTMIASSELTAEDWFKEEQRDAIRTISPEADG